MLVGSANKHSSVFKASLAGVTGVTGVSNQLVEVLIELVNTCCFLASAVDDLVVKPRLFACETRRLAESGRITANSRQLYNTGNKHSHPYERHLYCHESSASCGGFHVEPRSFCSSWSIYHHFSLVCEQLHICTLAESGFLCRSALTEQRGVLGVYLLITPVFLLFRRQ